MKLILTSSGLDTHRLKASLSFLLKQRASKSKAIVIHSLQKQKHLLYVHKAGQELAQVGILHPNIIYLNISSERSLPLVAFDVIYVCGGNTYYILDRMRKTGLDTFIKRSIKKGSIYIGVSAGSIIAGDTIEIAGWGSTGDTNAIKLKNLEGLHLVKTAVFPHYIQRLKNEVATFKEHVDYPVEALRDGEALIVIGNKQRRLNISTH